MTVTITCSCGAQLVTQDMQKVIMFRLEHKAKGHKHQVKESGGVRKKGD